MYFDDTNNIAPSADEQLQQQEFQQLAQKFYYQLTVGCRNISCSNKLCKKAASPAVSDASAKVLALQLASRPNGRILLCSFLPESPTIPQKVASKSANDLTTLDKHQPFINSVLSSSPFASFFTTNTSHPSTAISMWQRTKSFTNLLMLGMNKDFRYNTPTDSSWNTPNVSPPVSRNLSRSSSYDTLNLPESINYESFCTWIAQDPTKVEFQRIPSVLKHIFSRQDCLCTSFRLNNDKHDIAYSQTGVIVGVDVMQVRQFFAVLSGKQKSPLSESQRVLFYEAVENALELLLSKLDYSSRKWRINAAINKQPVKDMTPAEQLREKQGSFYKLRNVSSNSLASDLSVLDLSDSVYRLSQIAIILESPFLTNYHIAKKVAVIISKLHKSVKKDFVIQMALCYKNDPSGFTAIVTHFKRILCLRYHPNNANTVVAPAVTSVSKEKLEEDGIVASVRVLSFLYNINDFVGRFYQTISPSEDSVCEYLDGVPLRTIIPFWEFYCTTSSSNVFHTNKSPDAEHLVLPNLPLKKLYFKFMHIHTHPEQLSSAFSLLNYPFLLDPIAKTRIIRVESLTWMSGEFEDAFVRQGFVGSLKRVIESVGNISAISTDPDSESSHVITPSTIQAALQRLDSTYSMAINPYCVFEVTRDDLIKDTMMQWVDLHKPLKIKFRREEGLDQGGVQKEFFQLILSQILDPEEGLFLYDQETRLSWLNAFSHEDSSAYLLFGAILGLALYNGVMVDIKFPLVFYKMLLNNLDDEDVEYILNLDDLAQLKPQTYKGLCGLLSWDSSDGLVEDIFCRTFEIAYEHQSKVYTYPLVEGGEDIYVNELNRELYVQLYVRHVLQDHVLHIFKPLREGFWRVVGGPEYLRFSLDAETRNSTIKNRKIPSAIELFRPEELQALLVGLSLADKQSIYSKDAFKQLQEVVMYEDFDKDSPIIRQFWSIVLDEFTDEQRRKLLWFVTASDRIPLGGMKEVVFVIQRNGGDSDRLPTALTCFGRLLLPQYFTRERLQTCLSLAIEESHGFGLI